MENTNGKISETKRPAWFRNLFNFRFFSDGHPKISPQAVVSPKAEIADDVEIGPFCLIGPEVKIEPGCKLLNSVTVVGQTTIGRDNIFFPNSVIGTAPQDKKYKGAPTRLEIGNGNAFREAVTVHCGTEKGGGVTRIGDNNLFMVNSHVGHDAQIGSHCVFANNVMIAGHCIVGNGAAMMGAVGLHHFVTVGHFAYIGAYSRVHHDVPPFVKVDGSDQIRGLNKVGMTRSGLYAPEDIAAVDKAYRRLFLRRRPLSQAMSEFDALEELNPHVRQLIEFLHRRNQGRNGRYLEGQRHKDAAATANAEPAQAEAPPQDSPESEALQLEMPTNGTPLPESIPGDDPRIETEPAAALASSNGDASHHSE
jgi:UDP-N-acetylglucosamine acyltransferase